MTHPRPLAWALALALLCALLPRLAGAAAPQPEGVIIRVDGSLAYIDAGQQQFVHGGEGRAADQLGGAVAMVLQRIDDTHQRHAR